MFDKIRNNLKKAFHDVSRDPDYAQSRNYTSVGWNIIIPGQLIRLAKIDGQFLFPQFMRHHMSNMADAWTAAAMLDYGQMGVSALMRKEIKSRPLTCAGAALAVMTLHEVFTAQLPGRKFDWIDQSLHTTSAAAFVLAKRFGKKPLPKPEP